MPQVYTVTSNEVKTATPGETGPNSLGSVILQRAWNKYAVVRISSDMHLEVMSRTVEGSKLAKFPVIQFNKFAMLVNNSQQPMFREDTYIGENFEIPSFEEYKEKVNATTN